MQLQIIKILKRNKTRVAFGLCTAVALEIGCLFNEKLDELIGKQAERDNELDHSIKNLTAVIDRLDKINPYHPIEQEQTKLAIDDLRFTIKSLARVRDEL